MKILLVLTLSLAAIGFTAAPYAAQAVDRDVAAAIAAGDVARAIAAYTRLVTRTGDASPDALAAVARAGVAPLVTHRADPIRVAACGIVLASRAAAPECNSALDAISKRVGDDQAIEVYRLANAGYRPWPDRIASFAEKMKVPTRLLIVDTDRRLPAAERVALLEPIFDDDTDTQAQSRAAYLLAEIGGVEATTLLKAKLARPNEPLPRLPVLFALAQLGDPEAIRQTETLRTSIGGRDAVEVGTALAIAGSPLGPRINNLLEALQGREKVHIALLTHPRQPDASRQAIREVIGSPAADQRQAALLAAGVIGLGGEAVVLDRLLDTEMAVRIAAAHAALQTADALRRGRLPHP